MRLFLCEVCLISSINAILTFLILETELHKKDKRISLLITDDSQEGQISDAADFQNLSPQTTSEKPQSLEFLNDFESKTVEP
ncbi:putative malate dehydrogenase 1B isoform X2 [Cebus imitator]|uniref:putative malate dehydrogenase 1B isoform X2 n=1 Tax=Cebus imitator TaxID=2715852 RepID=UPI00080A5851|nr:putative malate dehydrogenase 1B isoform X2 [Cebus imitator]